MTVVQSLLDDWHNELGEMDKGERRKNIQLAQYYGPSTGGTPCLLGLLRRRRVASDGGARDSGQGQQSGERGY